jgi:DNA-3-methyladenine glycosylase I
MNFVIPVALQLHFFSKSKNVAYYMQKPNRTMLERNMKKRCDWLTDNDVYIKYHDEEWGVPVYDDRLLLEMLLLEGSQAGLNWLTILKRRKTYKKAYDNFDPEKIAKWTDNKMQKLLKDPGIIRNKLKVSAAKQNAQAYMQIVKEYGTFKMYIWSFVGNKPITNNWESLSEIPATTKESDTMSKSLKKKGFKFVGSTICYAFMQAVGMVNDHITACYRYKEIKKTYNNEIQRTLTRR